MVMVMAIVQTFWPEMLLGGSLLHHAVSVATTTAALSVLGCLLATLFDGVLGGIHAAPAVFCVFVNAALEESALHGTGPSGAPISRSYPSGRRPATAVAPRSEFGLEPHHTKEFADRVRQEYLADDPCAFLLFLVFGFWFCVAVRRLRALPSTRMRLTLLAPAAAVYTTGTASRRSAATGSKGSRSPRPATAGSMCVLCDAVVPCGRSHVGLHTHTTCEHRASKGKKKKITKPRPFVNMEMRTGTVRALGRAQRHLRCFKLCMQPT